ncbi:hypothetical protein Pyn_16203 [Prunus yedoensis var. nudiflora]|uniref:Uncharacterized protein n=1 Tax=Prunus yedoensis var. nudiflora TaxID=2094558 RepID=A0A314YFX9_PRUYE|nr:hypothetical protein Pyn_16203 [Prunus yedoensis var. nudiflora]
MVSHHHAAVWLTLSCFTLVASAFSTLLFLSAYALPSFDLLVFAGAGVSLEIGAGRWQFLFSSIPRTKPLANSFLWFSLSCFTLVSSVYSKLLQSNLVHLVVVGGVGLESLSPEIVAAHPNEKL